MIGSRLVLSGAIIAQQTPRYQLRLPDVLIVVSRITTKRPGQSTSANRSIARITD